MKGKGSLLTVLTLLLAAVATTSVGTPFVTATPPAKDGSPVEVVPTDGPGDATTLTVPADAPAGYRVRVCLAAQVVRVYLDSTLVREMVCSTGAADSPTPTGQYRIQNRGEFFFSEEYQQGGKWWVSFEDWGIYLFHSLPTDRDGNFLVEEAGKLGQPASHGCVRLAPEDARWFYDTIPEGACVDIE